MVDMKHTTPSPQALLVGFGPTKKHRALPHSCRETNIYWYLDNRCKSRVSKITVGLGVAVAILCLVILVLAILLCIAKRPKSSERWGDTAAWVGRRRRA